jgi:16S rRNA (adenine1518-N6/adenine1519-N6)-dimethyltransferase
MVEIGPGLGALTGPLLDCCPTLIAIEIDRDLSDLLRKRYVDQSGFKLHCGDALQTDLASLGHQKPVRVVGNLPYNISTPLLFHLLTFDSLIIDMHFMLQKEVVGRLAASPGNKAYGRLSLMVQYHCEVEPLFEVPASAFKPPPKVDSVFVRMKPYAEPPCQANDLELFSQVVKHCFQHRRKTLRNSLKNITGNSASLAALDVDLSLRPERLSVADFVNLSNQLSSMSQPS